MFDFKFRSWWDPGAEERLRARWHEAAREAAEFVARRARELCPVDTGELRGSIVVEPSMGGAVWNILVKAPHAKHVEFGTTHHLPNGVSYFIPPNPFLRTAMAEGRARFPAILRDVMVTSRGGEFLGATIRRAA